MRGSRKLSLRGSNSVNVFFLLDEARQDPNTTKPSLARQRNAIQMREHKEGKDQDRYNPVPHSTRDTIIESDKNTRKHHTQ